MRQLDQDEKILATKYWQVGEKKPVETRVDKRTTGKIIGNGTERRRGRKKATRTEREAKSEDITKLRNGRRKERRNRKPKGISTSEGRRARSEDVGWKERSLRRVWMCSIRGRRVIGSD